MMVWKIFLKDLLIEFRTRESLFSMIIFSALIVLVFNFSVELKPLQIRELSGGILWVIYLFASILGLNHSFRIEKENLAIQQLMLQETDWGLIYFGKFLANYFLLLLVELFTLPLFFLFLDFEITGSFWHFILVLLLGNGGVTAVGTLFSGISVNTRLREVMLPVLLFPVTMPVLIAAARITRSLVIGEPSTVYGNYFGLLVAYNVLFIAVSYLIFHHILEE